MSSKLFRAFRRGRTRWYSFGRMAETRSACCTRPKEPNLTAPPPFFGEARRFHFAFAEVDSDFIYLLAKFKNVGQFGAGVCPPLCWRKAMSPSIKAVSIAGNSAVPRSFFPNRR